MPKRIVTTQKLCNSVDHMLRQNQNSSISRLVYVSKGVKVNLQTYIELLQGSLMPLFKEKFGHAPWDFQQDRALDHCAKKPANS